jgi:leader peptidase (prepilin peptidase)/N-methyltransferase
MPGFVAAICGIFGLAVGSFLNVVIWRVPRKESVVSPPSHCPGCDAPIAPRDNIPVVSWLLLRGKCRNCGTRISARYPLVELLNAVLWAGVGARLYDSWALVPYLIFTAALVAITFIDLDHFIIPNRIVYPIGFVTIPMLGLASLLDDNAHAFVRALIAAVAAYAFFFVLHIAVPNGMGFGDVKLSFLLGAFLGYLGAGYAVFGIFAGFIYGSVVGLVLMASGRHGRRQHIPFGPFLAAGTMTFVLAGAPFIDWYSSLGSK